MLLILADAAPRTAPNAANLALLWILIIVPIFLSKQRLKTFLMALAGFTSGMLCGVIMGFITGLSSGATGRISGLLAMLMAALLSVGHCVRSKRTSPKSKSASV
jgi:predicted lipid-binding transport protein (Tim44 family)